MSAFFAKVKGCAAAARRQVAQAGYILGKPDRQMASIRKMGRSGDLKHVSLLIFALERRNHDIVRAEAALALGELKAADATFSLIELLEDSSEIVQEAAARGLGMIGDERAIQALVSLLKH